MAHKITAKEALFCEYYKILRSPREAAARAGYAFPERSGIKLLCRERIREEINRITLPETEAVDGLRRLAFGSIADAVYLCTCSETVQRNELEKLDLFSVSELKFTKGGGVEVKFFDRIKALDILSSQSAAADGSSAEPFYRALCEGAKSLADGGVGDGV